MIIFGVRGVTYGAGSGEFHCPHCRSRGPYRRRRVRRFFTLYFIPVLPLGLAGEYVECERCQRKYEPDVLELGAAGGPGAAPAAPRADLHAAIRRLLAAMATAYGPPDDRELSTARSVYRQVAGADLSAAELSAEVDRARRDGGDPCPALASLAGALDDQGREALIRAAWVVATADGELRVEERALLGRVAEALGMSRAHLRGVLEELVEGR